MSDDDLRFLKSCPGVAAWRLALATRVESTGVQRVIVGLILLNAAILGLETDAGMMARWGGILTVIDKLCLVAFVAELAAKMAAYRWRFWRTGWNVFDFVVVAIALVPGAGGWSVLRSLRVLRVLRLLTVVPALRKVVAAFLHAIPGIGGVMMVLAIFLYTAAVLAQNLFGAGYPEWFGGLGRSLFSLFQILTLEGWADMARTIMHTHPWAAAFFIPFILVATFTVLNLFIGIIVSTMQELATAPDTAAEPSNPVADRPDPAALISRIEADLQALRAALAKTTTGPRETR